MGCCTPNDKNTSYSSCCASDSPASTHETVRAGYAKIAESGTLSTITSPEGGGCCGSTAGKAGWTHEELADRLGYSADEVAALPDGANMGLSCGNPTAIAALQPGQVVMDLGSGGGFDCFLAGPKVGETGRVIGVDMTPEMLTKARNNTDHYRKTTSLNNVEFRLGEIEYLPAADNSVDVIISNCVINLSPDKPQVWREIARVLKPGGRVAASDMALFKPLPENVREDMASLVGCVAGAVLVDEYRAMVEDAGLVDVVLTPKPEYVAALSQFEDPLYKKIAAALPTDTTAADYITSLDVQAIKR